MRRLVVVLVILGLIPSFLRLGLYSVNYLEVGRAGMPSVQSINSLSPIYPAYNALQYLSRLDKNVRVFTFRQADLAGYASSNVSWIDNFDPRAFQFLSSQSEDDLYSRLIQSRIDFILQPNYQWPTLYRTSFVRLLANTKRVLPVFSQIQSTGLGSRSYQLFKILDSTHASDAKQDCYSLTESAFDSFEIKRSLTSQLFDHLLGIPTEYLPLNSDFRSKVTKDSVRPDFVYALVYSPVNRDVPNMVLSVKGNLVGVGLYTLSVQGKESQDLFHNLVKTSRNTILAQTIPDSQSKIGRLGGSVPVENRWKEIALILSAPSSSLQKLTKLTLDVCFQPIDEIRQSENPEPIKVVVDCLENACVSRTLIKPGSQMCEDSKSCTYFNPVTKEPSSDGVSNSLLFVRNFVCSKLCSYLAPRAIELPNWAKLTRDDFSYLSYNITCASACFSATGTFTTVWRDKSGSDHRIPFNLSIAKGSVTKIFLPANAISSKNWTLYTDKRVKIFPTFKIWKENDV